MRDLRCYRECSGAIVKKYRNCFGQYVFQIDDPNGRVIVCVGKGLFKMYDIDTNVIVGIVGRKLVNIRPIDC